jgi:hypothetical protein
MTNHEFPRAISHTDGFFEMIEAPFPHHSNIPAQSAIQHQTVNGQKQ